MSNPSFWQTCQPRIIAQIFELHGQFVVESKTTNTLTLALQKNVFAVGSLGTEVFILLVLRTEGDTPDWFCQAAGPGYFDRIWTWTQELRLGLFTMRSYSTFFSLGVVWWSLAIVSSAPPSNLTRESHLSWNEIVLHYTLDVIWFLFSLWWTLGRKKIMFKCEVVNILYAPKTQDCIVVPRDRNPNQHICYTHSTEYKPT